MRSQGSCAVKKSKRVLVACEYSGVVRDAFRRLGHHAYSCDLLQSNSAYHHQGDVREVLAGQHWDLMVAHPPCTHLAVSGARHFKNKQQEQKEALEFVRLLMDADIPQIAIENPVSVISTKIRKPDQIVHPYMFGDPVKKKTCLWLKGLPLLEPTNEVEPETVKLANGDVYSKWDYEISKMPHDQRGHLRSKTFEGFANAMAEQWGQA